MPIVTVDDVTIFGSTESISIFESFFNFDEKSSLAEIRDRYPICKIYNQINGQTVYREEMINKFKFHYPDYDDNRPKGNYTLV